MVLVVVLYLGLTYNRWWMAPVGSVSILILAQLAWPDRGTEKLGLNMSSGQIGISLFLLGLLSIGSITIVRTVAPGEGLSLLPVYQNRKWATLLVHTLGQTLNEEMVLGVLLLRYVTSRFRSLPPAVVSTIVAMGFSLLHFVFYGLRPPQSPNYGQLSLWTLLSLFAMGVVRNNCILSAGHIGYAWAIHMGWNVGFIDTWFYLPGSDTRLAEPLVFNLVLGNRYLSTIAAVLMMFSFLLYVNKRPVWGD
jgi:hypothetical protein